MDAGRFTLSAACKPPKTYPFVTLAEAVTFLALGKFKTSQTLLRVYRRRGYRFSSLLQKSFDGVGADLTTLARDGKLEIVGQCQQAEGAELEAASPIPRDYFTRCICVDAMRDTMEPDCEIGDNWANPFPRYRYVQIDMRQLEKWYPDGLKQEPSTEASAEAVEASGTSIRRAPTRKDAEEFERWAEQLRAARGTYPTRKEAVQFANERNIGREWALGQCKALPGEFRLKRGSRIAPK